MILSLEIVWVLIVVGWSTSVVLFSWTVAQLVSGAVPTLDGGAVAQALHVHGCQAQAVDHPRGEETAAAAGWDGVSYTLTCLRDEENLQKFYS